MKKGRSLAVLVVAVAAICVAFATPARADFFIDTSITALGQGFGAVPRLLTVQATGNATTEFACNSNSGGTLVQTCAAADASIGGNGLINGTVGTDGNVSPAGDTAKNNIVSLSALGITDASQILINYNPSEPGSSPETNILDFTLKFYDAAGNLVTSVDGGCGTACANDGTDVLFFGDTGTNLGNGGVGFVLALDAAQAAALNAACGANLSGCATVTGEATIDLIGDGPDSFTLFSRAIAAPEPGSLVLLGGALMGLAGLQWRRRR